MARSDRLLRLLQAMRVMPAPITAARLAEETGVSLRSLYRDVDALRAAGARIEGERGYGYRLVEDYALPPQTLDRNELEALALGLAEVQRMGDATLAKAAASVLAKVGARLPEGHEQRLVHAISLVYRPETRLASADMDMIRAACWDERVLRLHYTDQQGVASEREIQPLALVYAERSLTVLAWCCLREDFRMFRSERIAMVEDAGRSFRPARAALLRDYLGRLRDREGASEPEHAAPSGLSGPVT